jgi:glycosyltransferase involved in cell wall biosynthesis
MPGSETAPPGWPGWPSEKRFALILTHDVEGEIGLGRCEQLMRLEMELGFRSSFNFIPEGPYQVPRQLREDLVRNAFEVGVHDLNHDGRLYRSWREFSGKAEKINHYLKEWGAVGFRSGFMLNKLDWLHALNIEYDMSTFDTDPFEPQPEGRHTIFPFFVERPASLNYPLGGYVELPYTLPQDLTLFRLLGEKSVDVWKRKLDWIAGHGGMVLLDTHPDYMSFGSVRKFAEYPVEFYREFLKYVRDKYSDQYWHPLPRGAARYIADRGTGRATIAREVYEPNASSKIRRLRGRRAAVLLFSHYPADPRPRRAAEALAAEGVVIDLICLKGMQTELSREAYGNINVLRLPLRRQRGGKLSYIGQYTVFVFVCLFLLSARCLNRRYDFVHVHNMPDVLVFSALIPKILGAKVVLDLHDPMPELMQTIFKLPEKSPSVNLLKRFEKWSIGFANLVLTVNLACKKIYSSRSCPAEKIHVVLNSPDERIFRFQPADSTPQNGSTSSKPFEILYHGSLVRRNGFDLAVDALELVKQDIPTAKLTVCGARTGYFDGVLQSAQERGLGDRIHYLGSLNLAEITQIIEGCDLGIIPNHRNIFTEINTPTRIFEYLSLGRPVIAPRAPGIQDYFGDRDLIFFELGDAADLARQILYAYSHPPEVKETVKRGQAIYLAHTWHLERLAFLNSISNLL